MRALAIAAASAAALLLAASPTRADGPPPIDEAIAEARESGRALVIEFYTTWCGPCKQFKAEVLPRQDVKTALESVHFLQYDAERGVGKPAAKRYKVSGFPTFVVIDGEGQAVLTKLGSLDAERFIAFLSRADLEVLDEAGVRKRVAADPHDPGVLLGAARWHRERGNPGEALAYYRRARAADLGNEQGVAAMASWEEMELRRYHEIRDEMVREWTMFVRQYPTSPSAMHAYSVVAASGELSPKTREGLARLLLGAIGDDADRLNSAVYTFLAAGAPNAAVEAARRQVALDPKQANPHDTLAEALHYAGKKAEALAVSKRAIELGTAQQKPIFEANLRRFEKPGVEPGYDVEVNAYRAAGHIRDLPGTDPAAEKKQPPPKRPPYPGATQRPSFRLMAMNAFRDAGSACSKFAGTLPEVYVRLEVTGGTRKVVVLEPGAPRRLVRCLSKEIAGAELPDAPKDETRLTLPIRLAGK